MNGNDGDEWNRINQKDVESRPQPASIKDLMQVLPNIDVSDVVDIPKVFQCDEQTRPCDHTTKFRTLTGWCNNLHIPELGKSMRAFIRLLPPRYEDGNIPEIFKSFLSATSLRFK